MCLKVVKVVKAEHQYECLSATILTLLVPNYHHHTVSI